MKYARVPLPSVVVQFLVGWEASWSVVGCERLFVESPTPRDRMQLGTCSRAKPQHESSRAAKGGCAVGPPGDVLENADGLEERLRIQLRCG